MSKVLIDRELLEGVLDDPRLVVAMKSDQIYGIRDALAQSEEVEGVRNYLAEFYEGEVEAKTAIADLQAALSAVTAELDAERNLRREVATAFGRYKDEAKTDRDQLRAEVEYLRTDALSFGDAYQAVRHSLSRASNGERFSISLVQRTFLLGYNSALRLIEDMARRGDIVPDGDGCGYRFPGAAMAAKEG